MTSLVGFVRRSLWLMLLLAAVGAAYTWWRDRSATTTPGPAEWPPLPTEPASASPAASSPTVPDPGPSGSDDAAATVKAVVDAVVDTPEQAGDNAWVEPADDGSCPLTHPIKANNNSGIFHVPEGRFYARTKAERCYATADGAVADGYRQAKN